MIKLFAMDVDGTLTDGGIYMDGNGGELKRFDVQDGQGIKALLAAGVKVVFLSGRVSAPTEQRAQNLGITRCITGASDKKAVLEALTDEWGIARAETAFAGDDTPDAEAMAWAGLGIAVANAHPAAASAAAYITKKSGGAGAIREAADYILTLNGETEFEKQ